MTEQLILTLSLSQIWLIENVSLLMSESSFSYIVVLVLIYLSLLFQNKHINIMWVFPCKSESEVAQSRLTLCDPVDCSLPCSSLHGILQARVLEWGATSFSRGSSFPGLIPGSPALQADALWSEPPGKSKGWESKDQIQKKQSDRTDRSCCTVGCKR